jgi:hypothetical protein
MHIKFVVLLDIFTLRTYIFFENLYFYGRKGFRRSSNDEYDICVRRDRILKGLPV